MKDEKYSKAIEAEKTKLARFIEARADLDEKIKSTEAKIEQLIMLENNWMVTAANSVLEVKGLSFKDVLVAIQKGDLESLQEILTTK